MRPLRLHHGEPAKKEVSGRRWPRDATQIARIVIEVGVLRCMFALKACWGITLGEAEEVLGLAGADRPCVAVPAPLPDIRSVICSGLPDDTQRSASPPLVLAPHAPCSGVRSHFASMLDLVLRVEPTPPWMMACEEHCLGLAPHGHSLPRQFRACTTYRPLAVGALSSQPSHRRPRSVPSREAPQPPPPSVCFVPAIQPPLQARRSACLARCCMVSCSSHIASSHSRKLL